MKYRFAVNRSGARRLDRCTGGRPGIARWAVSRARQAALGQLPVEVPPAASGVATRPQLDPRLRDVELCDRRNLDRGQRLAGPLEHLRDGGPMHFQPSEWVKLVLILAVARYFANLGGRSLTWRDILKAFAMVAVPMLLVMKQPDLGTALTYMPILVAGLFLGGINIRQSLILVTCGTVLIAGVWTSGKILKPFQKARLTSFVNPDSDPRGTGYQIRQSLIAVGSGGIWGQGAAKGTQTQGDFLPIPHADFIYAAFSEEHGFVGALFVLLLYFFILMRLIQNAQTAADLSGSLIIMGVVAVLTFQILVNVGMVIGFMPVTGIPLPLMSYGGSSVLFTFLALGAAMNVRMRRFVN